MACHLSSDMVQKKVTNYVGLFGGNKRQLRGQFTKWILLLPVHRNTQKFFCCLQNNIFDPTTIVSNQSSGTVKCTMS